MDSDRTHDAARSSSTSFNGLIVGAFYALMALGLSLILNLTGVINFAHGGFLALGAYLAYTLMPYIGFWGALAGGAAS